MYPVKGLGYGSRADDIQGKAIRVANIERSLYTANRSIMCIALDVGRRRLQDG